MRNIIALTLIVGMFGSARGFAAEATKANPVQQSLAAVPSPEMPAKAAELVKAAKSRDRGRVTVEVVKAALAKNPGAAMSVVGAIAKAVPDMAAIAAGAAAEEQPARAADIARAAAAAAPAKAGKIVAAVCRAAPQDYRNIALRVAQVAPGSEKEILRSIASVFPDLKPGIDRSLAGIGSATPSVAAVLDAARPSGVSGLAASAQGSSSSTAATRTAPDGLPRGPSIAPPYIPLPVGATNINPSTSGTVPRGDRNYAAP
jgi:hypothetical protein